MPTSTTCSGGKSKKRAALAALRCMNANRCSRQRRMPGISVARIVSLPMKYVTSAGSIPNSDETMLPRATGMLGSSKNPYSRTIWWNPSPRSWTVVREAGGTRGLPTTLTATSTTDS